ncbi:MAG: glycosyl hydrolase family 28-related protein [Anaerolineae bacterium]
MVADVMKHYGIAGDGVSDDTRAIQTALDEAGKKGEVVQLPAGQFRINGTLSIPPGTTLAGVWRGPHSAMVERGTVLLAYAGRDDESASPFISLTHSSTLQGVTIWYPEQLPLAIHPYPWTLAIRGHHPTVLEVTIVNAYNGIDNGSQHSECPMLRNVHMCCLKRGVYLDQTSDIPRYENVHIHSVYWWRLHYPESHLPQEDVKAIEDFTLANLEGFIIGRTDWGYISNCFVIWARIGWHFLRTATPAGGTGNVTITQSGSDIGPLAVLVDETQAHAGIAFENCQFMSTVEVAESNRGPVKLVNCGFWGIGQTVEQVRKHGPSTLMLQSCHFNGWDAAGEGAPCIRADGGRLMVMGCEFMHEEKEQIRLMKGLKAAVISGNLLREKGINRQGCDGDIELVGNTLA